MKKVLAVFFYLLSLSSWSQNWEMIQAKDTIHFNYQDLHSVAVDSHYYSQGVEVFRFNEILNDSAYDNLIYVNTIYKKITKPNIFGKELKIHQDSVFITNQSGHRLLLFPKANLNQTWIIDSLNNTFCVGKVDSIKTDSIQGSLDSIKFISYRWFDSLQNPITNPVDSEKFIISKNHGIIQTLNWYQFPLNNNQGLYNTKLEREFIRLNFTKREFYDYNVGDEYHISIGDHFSTNNAPPDPADFSNNVILTKSYSANMDTMFYSISVKYEKNECYLASSSGPIIYTQQFRHDTTNHLVANLSKPAIKALGKQVFTRKTPGSQHSYSAGYVKSFYARNKNRVGFTEHNLIFEYDSLAGSWIYSPYFIENLSKTIQGICYLYGFYNHSIFNMGGHTESLIYYKKGLETWGQPRIVTNLNVAKEGKEEIELFPNPSNGKLTIKTEGLDEILGIEVFDISGRLSKSISNFNSTEIDLSELAKGMYFLKINQAEKAITKKIILE